MKLGLLGFDPDRKKNLGIYRVESNTHIQSFNGNLSLYDYTGELSLSFGSPAETLALGLAFSSDGQYLYIVGDTNNKIYKYTLSTPWDVSSSNGTVTESYTNSNIGRGIYFSTDGTKMFIVFTSSIGTFNLSSPWSLSSPSFVHTFNPSAGGLFDLTFSENGTELFIISTTKPSTSGINTKYILKYTLSTAWNLSTASFTYSIDVSGIEFSAQGVALDSNVKKLYFNGTISDKVYAYDLQNGTISGTGNNTAYVGTIDSFTYTGSLQGHEPIPYSLFVNTKNNNFDFYFVGDKEIVYQYRLILK